MESGNGRTDEKIRMRSLRLFSRGTKNYILKRPFCVSFEITRKCNARCDHCHLGVPIKEERATAREYAMICRAIRPVVAQISGGEPMLRKDLEEIIIEMKRQDKIPYVILTTNAILLTPEKYYSLRRAGVDKFSISLDYPDDRHDSFRNTPGLFGRIESTIQEIDPRDRNAISLSAVIQSKNFRELMALVELAFRWKVRMNFSTYTYLRTKNMDFMLSADELGEFKGIIKNILKFKKKWGTVLPSQYVFDRMVRYFENGGLPNCQAGQRFMIVNPDATLSPCGLIMGSYDTREELVREFSGKNTCEDCYTAIRANAEKSPRYLIVDSIRSR